MVKGNKTTYPLRPLTISLKNFLEYLNTGGYTLHFASQALFFHTIAAHFIHLLNNGFSTNLIRSISTKMQTTKIAITLKIA